MMLILKSNNPAGHTSASRESQLFLSFSPTEDERQNLGALIILLTERQADIDQELNKEPQQRRLIAPVLLTPMPIAGLQIVP